MFVPRSCQVTRRSRHMFCIAYRTVLFFFIILPLPKRPKNTFTLTLTLSGSFFEHLNGGWFRNRFALSCVLCSVLQRVFLPIREECCAFFLFHDFLTCAAASHPAFFVTSADIPSLYSLNSVICVFHLQQEKRLGCTSFHFELCFLRASLHHCRPPVLKAIAVCVSLPDLAMYPAHQCTKKSLFVLVHVEPFQDRVSFRCFFLATILSILCVLLSSILLCLRHFLLSMTSVFLAMSLSAAAQQVTTTDSAILTSPLPPFHFHKGSSGKFEDSLPFVYVLFLPHSIPVMNVSTKANFSVHCSIPLPASHLSTSCFCVELQFIYMVNVLSKSKPGHGRETTARQHDRQLWYATDCFPRSDLQHIVTVTLTPVRATCWKQRTRCVPGHYR